MKYPATDSATWRACVTGLQTFIPFMAALAALPEVRAYITTQHPELVPLVTVGAAVASFALNYFRKDVKNY